MKPEYLHGVRVDDGLPQDAPLVLLQHPQHVVPAVARVVGGGDHDVSPWAEEEAGGHLAEVDEVAGAGHLEGSGSQYRNLGNWIFLR